MGYQINPLKRCISLVFKAISPNRALFIAFRVAKVTGWLYVVIFQVLGNVKVWTFQSADSAVLFRAGVKEIVNQPTFFHALSSYFFRSFFNPSSLLSPPKVIALDIFDLL